jgi:phosphoadenosine phosphosulfate reductase
MLPDPTRVAQLNDSYKHHSAADVLRHALTDPAIGRLAMVSAFGAESVVLLHMVAMIDNATPVIFIDTEMLFAETLTYQMEVTERLRLSDVRIIGPDRADLFTQDNESLLHLHDPDACCALRKTVPLDRALRGFDGWITGRKRYQGGQRTTLPFFEVASGQIKVNPLAHWTPRDVQDYMDENRLPRHPLTAKGYPSIGCAPCTTRVASHEDARAGRWRDSEKTECGIHFGNGRMMRGQAPVF